MGHIGTIELAAHGIALLQWASIAFMIPLRPVAKAATVRVGVAHGQGDYATALIRASVSVIVISCAIAMAGGILLLSRRNSWAAGFPMFPPCQRRRRCLPCRAADRCGGLFQLVDGLQAIANRLLRA